MGTKGRFLLIGVGVLAVGASAATLPNQIWTYRSPTVQGSVAVGPDGTAYVLDGENLVALDLQGQVKWRFPRYNVPNWVPIRVGDDGTVYFQDFTRSEAGVSSSLVAVAPDGAKKWEYQPQSSPTSTTFVEPHVIGSDQVMYIGEGIREGGALPTVSRICAVDGSGNLLWRSTSGELGSNPIALAPRDVLLCYRGEFLEARDTSGRLLWNWRGGSRLSAVGLDGSLAIHSDGTLVATEYGSVRWRVTTTDENRGGGSPLAFGLDGRLFTYNSGLYSRLRQYDRWGNLEWEFALDPWLDTWWKGVVAASDGTIFVGANRVYWLGANGYPLWSTDSGSFPADVHSELVLDATGRLFVPLKGEVRVYQTRAAPANSGWPMTDADAAHTGRAESRPAAAIFSDMRWIAGRGFFSAMTGELGTVYDVMASTNLADWEVIGSLTHTNFVSDVVDPAAKDLPQRFYKLRVR